MLVIANNITTRNAKVEPAFRWLKAGVKEEQSAVSLLQELATRCVAAGADVLDINIQQHHNGPEAMEFAVRAVQQVTDRQLCLSTSDAVALDAGLRACKGPALANYVSLDETSIRAILPLIARHGAEAILLLTDPGMPSDAEEMLRRAAVLVGAANEAGIPNERILVDPGLLHITSDMGQGHFVELVECLRALAESFDPPLRTTCWIGNASAGAPVRLRPLIDTAVLAMLCGLGLSAAFADVLKRENMRMVRLVRILRNEAIYADGDLELCQSERLEQHVAGR